MRKIKNNDTVKLHYTGTLKDGSVFDSSEGKPPLEFKVGTGQVIPGFEEAAMDMQVGEEKTFTIPADKAYGAIRKELIQEIPNTQLPPEVKPEVGMQLMSTTAQGQQIPVTITQVKATSFVIDANHPMAGKDLTFKIKIDSIS